MVNCINNIVLCKLISEKRPFFHSLESSTMTTWLDLRAYMAGVTEIKELKVSSGCEFILLSQLSYAPYI